MAQVMSPRFQALRTAIAGQVFVPDDPGYDQARLVWNGAIDRRPAAIVRCADAADVRAAIGFARQQGLEIAVRGGSHSSSGACTVDDGLQIDLSAMRAVTVDPAARRASVAGGALLGDVDAAAQEHGLAVPAGLVSHTGVGGLTLGGGMGWLTRKAGLSIDSLVSAEVVTADGSIVQASERENPDLFWAIRGGGGNFGVVTRFEFKLHQAGPLVQFGLFFWSLEKTAEVLRLAEELISTVSRDVNIVVGGVNAPPEPFVPEQYRFLPGCVLLVTGFGSQEEHEAVVAGVRKQLPPLFDLVTPIPYVQLQKLLDEANAFGRCAYDKSHYIAELSDDVIAVVEEHLPRKASPLSPLLFYRLDGAYSEAGEDETAFSGGRSPRWNCFIVGVTDSPEKLAEERLWVRSFWEALRPHAMGTGFYVNGETDFVEDRVLKSYGPAKYARLARIKATYDPDNIFHLNANIPPAK
jgi:FAD/FMN-containing dehydrogenase